MASIFQKVASVALDEMIRKHLTCSKYGYFLSSEGLEELKKDLLGLLETSRNLRTAGQQFLKSEPQPSKDNSSEAFK